jgi:hypothetical protein
MKHNTLTDAQSSETSFEMFRLSRSKQTVDICPNTLRSWHAAGLKFYRIGKAVFISRAELAAFIRGKATA